MNNQEINDLIHKKLLPKQQSFKEYEKLAGNGFHFSSQVFRDCVKDIQEVIDIARELGG